MQILLSEYLRHIWLLTYVCWMPNTAMGYSALFKTKEKTFISLPSNISHKALTPSADATASVSNHSNSGESTSTAASNRLSFVFTRILPFLLFYVKRLTPSLKSDTCTPPSPVSIPPPQFTSISFESKYGAIYMLPLPCMQLMHQSLCPSMGLLAPIDVISTSLMVPSSLKYIFSTHILLEVKLFCEDR